jgi:hypothetical protein
MGCRPTQGHEKRVSTLHGSTVLKPNLLSRPGGPARQMSAQSGRTGTFYREDASAVGAAPANLRYSSGSSWKCFSTELTCAPIVLRRIDGTLNRGREILGMKTERARFALVKYTPIRRDQVKAIRPTSIRRLHLVIEAIDQRRKLDSELTYASSRNRCPLGLILGTCKQHSILDIRLHLPNVRGMCLEDINRVERNSVFVLIGQLVQSGNLPPEWRSCVAAKYQHHRFRLPQRAKLHRSPAV